MAELSDQEMLRYNRQIILRGFDFDGQEALKDSRVLIVGLGGLGCAASQYPFISSAFPRGRPLICPHHTCPCLPASRVSGKLFSFFRKFA